MTPITLPAGVVHSASKAEKSTNWREVNLIRWTRDTTRPIEGWENTGIGPFASRLRAVFKWASNTLNEYTAYLCEQHLYVQILDELRDITPAGGIVGPGTGVAGFGEGLFGVSTFGTPRAGSTKFTNLTPCYTLDNWGEELRAMTSADGRLLRWAPSFAPTAKAVAVTGAPISNRTFVVTPERYIILFGMGGERDKYGWCDQEDDTNWLFADPLSDAGFFNIEPKSAIVTACEGLGGIFMSSRNQAFFINYIGQPGIYAHTAKGAFTIPISASSIMETSDGVMWNSGDGNFWVFNGVSISPVDCEIRDWIKDQINLSKSAVHSFAMNVYTKTEAWFFFVSNSSADGYNDRVAIYNYKDRTWSMGTLGRACGFNYANDVNPLMSNGVKVYKHETGSTYVDYSDHPWLETHVVNMNEGSEFITIQNLFPEIIGDSSGIRFRLARSTVRQPNKETYTPQKSVRDNGYVDIRETARDFRLRIDADLASGWSLGIIGLNTVGRGKKT